MKKAEQEATRVVLFSASQDVEVSIDGGQPVTVSAGKFRSVSVGPGKHEIAVSGGRTIHAELDAFDRLAVPLEEQQCFFGIDVTMSHYSADGKKALGKIDVKNRRTASSPFVFPPHTYLTEGELPETRTGANSTFLLRSLPCEEVDRLEGESTKKGGTADASEGPSAPDPVSSFFADASACEAATGVTAGYCRYGKAWAKATATQLPAEGTYAGITLELDASETLEEVVAAGEAVSFFAVRRGDAPTGWITSLSGDDADEQAAVDAVVASVKKVVAGDADRAEAGEKLAAYLATMPDQAEAALVNGERSLSLGSTEIRRVDDVWLAATPNEEGVAFSIHVPIAP